MKRISIALLLLFIFTANSQEIKQSAFSFSYIYQFPIGNLATTFGNNSAIGGKYYFETQNNMFYGTEASYRFGNNIKDSTIFNNISTTNGEIIDGNGMYANINIMQRGFDAYLLVGYAFHHNKKNLSGIYIYQGVGYLENKIFINTKNQNIPQLNNEMKKGYDKYSSGFSTKFSIDYNYYHKKGKLQINAGVNYIMALMQNQRTYDFANNTRYSKKRNWEKLIGLKIEIIIPIQRRNKEEFHYF